jgi:predicted RNA-binding protein with PUA-like domain
MAYWLIKSDPDTYPYSRMLQEKQTFWDGVRNYQARNFLRSMKKGDLAFFYESVGAPMVMGVVEIVGEAYPDPTADDPAWLCVDVKWLKSLKHPVTLARIKARPELGDMVLVRNSRLSVQPVEPEAWQLILEMSAQNS